MVLKRYIPFLLLLLLVLVFNNANAQQRPGPDSLFTLARKAAFDQKNYTVAIQLCKEALQTSPGYTDIRVFLGRLYFWNDQTDSARSTLAQALQQDPPHEDAAVAAASIAYFTDRYDESIAYCDKGLQHHPHSTALLLQKAKTLTAMQKFQDAVLITDQLIKKEPSNTDVRALADRIKDFSSKNRIGFSYDYTNFQKQFNQGWHLASIDYSRQTKAGSFIARVNYGNRYGESGVQFEADAYPRIAKNFYAYVNVGYSPDLPVFAKFRSGLSIYANLPASFEVDAGFRYLNFDNDTWIYTGSIGKYWKSWWFNLRAYLTPDNDRIAHSYTATARYYLGGADDFLSLSLGSGISPDDRAQAIQLNSNYKLISRKAGLGYRFTVQQKNIFILSANYANVEYLPKTRDNQINIGAGYQRRF